jgi:hypothetical protein
MVPIDKPQRAVRASDSPESLVQIRTFAFHDGSGRVRSHAGPTIKALDIGQLAIADAQRLASLDADSALS